MPAPTSYTEAELAAYLVASLADVATALGWTASATQIQEAVTAVELACGASDIATATNIAQVRAIGRREAWGAAMGAAASWVDSSVPGGPNLKGSALYAQCHTNWLAASTDAMPYDATGVIGVASVTYAPDVYGPLNTAGEFG
jgi:hypothetical protein